MSTGMIIVVVVFLILLFAGFPCLFALGLPGLVWLLINPGVPSSMLATNMDHRSVRGEDR